MTLASSYSPISVSGQAGSVGLSCGMSSPFNQVQSDLRPSQVSDVHHVKLLCGIVGSSVCGRGRGALGGVSYHRALALRV